MNSQFLIVAILGIFGFALAGAEVANATPPTDACSLLTTTQLSAALDATVDQGKNTPEPSITPLNQHDCYCWQSGKSWIGAKRVQLKILDPTDQTTPVQAFQRPALTRE